MSDKARRLPVGAEARADGVHFRVWAPCAERVDVEIEGGPGEGEVLALESEAHGYYSGCSAGASAGSLYRYRLDGESAYPDPASRFQPAGPEGPSEVIDPGAYTWRDSAWRGPALERPVIYELHVGTFSSAGTWQAAAEHLSHIARLGANIIELLPIADFAGEYGWGYDGVDLYAPTRLYGRPDELRGFVDAAHAQGIGVVLDVVYNHFGPVGCYLHAFSEAYFSNVHTTDWGEAIRFYGLDSGPVREFFISNAGYWIDEYHIDGLRIDATQNIYDRSTPHIVTEIAERARGAAGSRRVYVIGESEPQDSRLVHSVAEGGFGLDAIWNDDFHHSAMVAATGHAEAYYMDYRGSAQELISAARRGFLYQGQYYIWQNRRRGRPALDLQPGRFINYLQNHDQLANSARGERLHVLTSPGRLRALTALLLLAPATPLLFMGQEFAAASPYFYFADFRGEVAELVRSGRRDFLAQFPSLEPAEAQDALPDPMDRRTFERSRLEWSDVQRNAHVLALHRDLIRLSRADATLRMRGAGRLDGAVLADECLLLRFFGDHAQDRLLIVNLGHQLEYRPASEPLLAAPAAHEWRLSWSSESPAYGAASTPAVERPDGWHMPASTALLFIPQPIPAKGT